MTDLLAGPAPIRAAAQRHPGGTRALNMGRVVLGKVASALIVLFVVATVAFLLVRMSGDPLALLLPPDATQQQVEQLAAELGLDQPLLVQYLHYLSGMLHGDLGQSIFFDQPVVSLIGERLPATALLAVAALVLSLVISLPAGILASAHRGRITDTVISGIVLIGQSTPAFWIGILFILLFAVRLRVLPAAGYGGAAHLVLPAITLAIYSIAVVARVLRTSLAEELSADYIRTATAKGLSRRQVVVGHGLRNASLPVVTVVGLEFGSLLGGAILTEQVFSWPGIGRLTVEAISNRDFALVQGAVLFFALVFVVVNLLVDLSYTLLDPRVRLGR
ncbi:ABC transporter permease [Mycolicibacterium smegmatis]|uniref:Dipeptide transport system permease protein DppB n=3 Tax=Mycolicibacterium smegmatis TaxID=1772 RepID=A0R7D2_MYCS2|nr:putative oligopeptide permease OppB [Mycolicibacterium smegmatis MC2 155]AIU18452.1 ABC transporter permease [Mycolicibacterium smegmatis]ABK72058.1 dipeptide transport system permease protein DppB [Mycolicibacterium smegmatis MC2 155]AFP43109.1 Oligopeptide ABC transporter permease [Mycolicibacterium smegmatis MC2 155]AIU11827.1 ABC transporter permease [Mycolicibacterium smegmatis MC2 155]